MLDKIRYEEATGIDIDETLKRFNVVRKDFQQYYKTIKGSDTWLPRSVSDFANIEDDLIATYDDKTANGLSMTLADIETYNTFRGRQGKKDRSDHRHHALDALIIALCSPFITRQLSTLNAAREIRGEGLYDEQGSLSRERVNCPLTYEEMKGSLKHILVLQKVSQRLLVANKNKIKRKSGPAYKHPSKSVRASLHKDTFYGKLKQPERQGIEKKVAYVTRFGNNIWEFNDPDKLDAIYDRHLREIIRRRIVWLKKEGIPINEDAYNKYPLYRYSPEHFPDGEPSPKEAVSMKTGKPLPVVKKVRTEYKNYRSVIAPPNDKYADADGNYIMALYELPEKKGKRNPSRHFKVLSTFEAVKARTQGRDLFPDEIEKDGNVLPLMRHCEHLKQGDTVVMYEDNVEEINWDNTDDLKKRLYIVSQLGSSIKKVDGKEYPFGTINLVKHNVSKAGAKYVNEAYKNGMHLPFIAMYHTQIKAVKVDNLGNVLIPMGI